MAAAPATSLSSLSSLASIHRLLSSPPSLLSHTTKLHTSPRLRHSVSTFLSPPFLPAPTLPLLSRAKPDDSSPDAFLSENVDSQENGSETAADDDDSGPLELPEGFVPPPSIDEGPFETEDEITGAYEELYGPAYSGVSVLGNDVYVMDAKAKAKAAAAAGLGGRPKKEKIKDGFEERVVQVRRVTKVVKGGKQLNFRAIVVVGDKKGQVGVGVAKAKEVISAVQKSATDARRNIISVPMTKYLTFPHRSEGDFGAARVMLRPASPGTGVIAGGAVRIVLEMAGVENALGKQLGSDNALNNARATIVAVSKMRQLSEVAAERGIPMEELWK